MDFQIYRARSNDWKLLRDTRLRSLADSPDSFYSTFAEEERLSDDDWRRRSENKSVGQYLAMTSDGEAIGMAIGAPFNGEAQTAGLFGMWVAPAARRNHVGAALVQSVIEWAQFEGYGRIILEVGDWNSAAIQFYNSLGFVPTGKAATFPPPRQHILEIQFERRFQ